MVEFTLPAASRPKPGKSWPKPAAAKQKPAGGGSLKKLLLIGGLAVVVLAGGFFAYRKLTAEPPPPPPRPKPVTNPAPPPVETVTPVPPAVDKPAETAAPVSGEVVQSNPAPATTETPAAPTAAPVAPPPPPPPTKIFKAWVEALKIGGVSVRAGKPTRMTIGKTTYDVGDQVNPQLGISFEAYNAETHTVTFKDKSGAKVERRP